MTKWTSSDRHAHLSPLARGPHWIRCRASGVDGEPKIGFGFAQPFPGQSFHKELCPCQRPRARRSLPSLAETAPPLRRRTVESPPSAHPRRDTSATFCIGADSWVSCPWMYSTFSAEQGIGFVMLRSKPPLSCQKRCRTRLPCRTALRGRHGGRVRLTGASDSFQLLART
jgi:hypothetical protein